MTSVGSGRDTERNAYGQALASRRKACAGMIAKQAENGGHSAEALPAIDTAIAEIESDLAKVDTRVDRAGPVAGLRLAALPAISDDMSEQLPGVPEPLEPLVARLLAPNPSPFTSTGTQVHLVGTTDLAIIDPGPDDPAHIDAIVRAVADRPVRAIVITHTHRDHSPASRPLAAATGAPIVGCAPLALDDGGIRSDASFDRDYAPDRVLAEGESVGGEGWTLTALATPGHTSNHLAFALPETQALFTGDHVMGWSTSIVSPPDGDMAAYMASLDKLMHRADRIYYPAHGDPVTNPRRLVRGMMGHRKQREGQILRLLREGAATIPAMVEKMYVGIDPRLFPAAERSVLAHLIDLRDRDRVVETGNAWSVTA